MLREVKIDKKLLEVFKRRAYKHYPKEYIECLWGTITTDGKCADIFAHSKVKILDSSNVDVEYVQPDKDLFQDHGWTLLGTLHTHPDAYTEPSTEDYEVPIFGICSIVIKGKRKFYSFAFFNGKRKLELTIGEF